eukprot:scaffold69177_cov62-Phaeocystis_antarctica.AAC.1
MGALELGERGLLLVRTLAVLERAVGLGGESRLLLGRVLVVLEHGIGLGRVPVHRVALGGAEEKLLASKCLPGCGSRGK